MKNHESKRCKIFNCDRRRGSYCCYYCEKQVYCRNYCQNNPAVCKQSYDKEG